MKTKIESIQKKEVTEQRDAPVDRMNLAFDNSRALADFIFMGAVSEVQAERGSLQSMALMLLEQIKIAETAAREIAGE